MSDAKALARQHAKSWYHEEWEDGSYIHEELVDEFERAILAERERCARLCEDTAMVVTSGRAKPDFGIYSGEPADMTAGNTHPGVGYAAFIRKGTTT